MLQHRWPKAEATAAQAAGGGSSQGGAERKRGEASSSCAKKKAAGCALGKHAKVAKRRMQVKSNTEPPRKRAQGKIQAWRHSMQRRVAARVEAEETAASQLARQAE